MLHHLFIHHTNPPPYITCSKPQIPFNSTLNLHNTTSTSKNLIHAHCSYRNHHITHIFISPPCTSNVTTTLTCNLTHISFIFSCQPYVVLNSHQATCLYHHQQPSLYTKNNKNINQPLHKQAHYNLHLQATTSTLIQSDNTTLLICSDHENIVFSITLHLVTFWIKSSIVPLCTYCFMVCLDFDSSFHFLSLCLCWIFQFECCNIDVTI